MKKILVFLPAMLFACCVVNAQSDPPASAQHMISTVSNVPNSELFKDKRTFYFYNESYVIDGHQVFGSPFLFHDWNNGTITTADGRVFTGYRLKYNAYDQTVYFSNGTDSLEVNDEIKDFSIINVYPDTLIISKFINASQLKKEKKVFYYEVLLDNEAGQLLKYNKKIVAEASKGIPVYEGKKVFELQSSFFYYDKKKKLVTAIKANGSNISSLVDVSSGPDPKNYDFSLDGDITAFFTRYFESLKAK
jgi:hypothetical protein